METIWFICVALMVAMYVLLDGFDLGAGAIHLFAARDERERRTIIRAIGPVWDGNEVWLLAAGGTLFFAFPLLYASGFSGFYLPLIIVLWLLMIRGLSIELRGHIGDPMWASFWDAMFFIGSALLAIFYGAALGNVVRGVPLNADGYFFQPLWTDFSPFSQNPGILDWYTVLIGLLALTTLVVHGANFIAVKTENELNARSRGISRLFIFATIALTVVATPATFWVSPRMLESFNERPYGYVLPLVAIAGLAGMVYFNMTEQRQGDLSLLQRLHRRDADQHRLRGVPERAARGGPGQQPHDLQRVFLRLQPGRGARLVEHRDGPRRRLLHRHLPPLPRQGAPRRRRVLILNITGKESRERA